ncbi:MAG: hypothetical protein RL591_1199, partial [Planctomycetota bacterium]
MIGSWTEFVAVVASSGRLSEAADAPNPATANIGAWLTGLLDQLRASEIPEIAAVDWMLLATLMPLLVAMAFFSFVETTYFALTPAERLALRRGHPRSSVLIEALLGKPRVLLVSTMLGS